MIQVEALRSLFRNRSIFVRFKSSLIFDVINAATFGTEQITAKPWRQEVFIVFFPFLPSAGHPAQIGFASWRRLAVGLHVLR
jgi:hypothetical protein